MFFDYHACREFIEDATSHYAKSAPALCDWLDELYIALADDPLHVSVLELLQLLQLRINESEWEPANYAQNRFYKLREVLGKNRGVISF